MMFSNVRSTIKVFGRFHCEQERVLERYYCSESDFINEMKLPPARAASFNASCDQPMTYWLQIGSSVFFKVARILFNVPTSQAEFGA